MKDLKESMKFLSDLLGTQLGRMGTAEEVAQAALFLASGGCSLFITGEALVVDGGHTVATRGNEIVIG